MRTRLVFLMAAMAIIASGCFKVNFTIDVNDDGSGTVEWENTTRVYVPSMLVKDNHLYAVADAGVAICWDSKTGEQRWKHRLGGSFTASPTFVGGTPKFCVFPEEEWARFFR